MNTHPKKCTSHLLSYFQRVEGFVMVALLVAIFLIVCAQVFCRFAMRHSLPWSEELTSYLFVWLAFLGFSCNVRTDDHPRVTFVTDKLSPSVQRFLVLLSRVCLLVLSMIVVWYGSRNAFLQLQTGRRATAIPVSMFWFSVSIPVGFLLGGIYSVIHIIQDYFGDERGNLTQ